MVSYSLNFSVNFYDAFLLVFVVYDFLAGAGVVILDPVVTLRGVFFVIQVE
jgi:hypothetical protein